MAIAFDNAGNVDGTVGATSAAVSFTMGAGANGILVFRVDDGNGSDTTTTATYGAQSCTKIGSYTVTSGDGAIGTVWYLINPTSGANTLTVNRTGTGDKLYIRILSYTGANQSSFPDNKTTNTQASGISLATSITPVADNCWALLFGEGQGGPLIAGTGSTARSTLDNRRAFDNNADITPAASTSMTITDVGNVRSVMMLSLAPSGGAVASSAYVNTLALLGGGT